MMENITCTLEVFGVANYKDGEMEFLILIILQAQQLFFLTMMNLLYQSLNSELCISLLLNALYKRLPSQRAKRSEWIAQQVCAKAVEDAAPRTAPTLCACWKCC